MKKLALLLVAMLIVSLFAFSSCGQNSKPCKEHVDADSDYICDNCGAELEKKDNPDTPCTEHIDANTDNVCDKCGEELADDTCVHVDANKDHACDNCGEANISECADGNNDHNCDVCGKKLSDCAAAENSHNCGVCGEKLSDCEAAENSHNCGVCGEKLSDCEAAENSHNCIVCGEKVSECSDADGDYVCDVCGEENLPENLERVNYYLNISDLEATTLSSDSINGKFTIVAGTEIRSRPKTFEGVAYDRSVKIGSSTSKIQISVPGTGKLSFLVQNGSSGAATQFISVTGPDGVTQDIEFDGTNTGSPVVKITVDVTAGEWTISRGKNGGTQDVFELNLSCVVEKSDENGFELVSAGTVDYLCGQQIDLSGLVLNATFANGKTDPLSLDNVTVDTSLVNMGASGTYPVTVSYKSYESITYYVNVYLPVSVTLGVDSTVLQGQSSVGNSLYINRSLKEVYSVGEALDLTGLSVIVNGKLSDDKPLMSFNVGDNYKVGEIDLSTAGTKTLTVSYVFGSENVTATLDLYVVDTAPSIVEDAYQVKVDADYAGVIGAVDNGYNMFTTIQQALDFLANSEAGKRKIMIIEEGYYQEKIEITIPNLHIKGVGADKVIIEWDSIYGIKDAGGFAQITDSTQTVAVRDTAYGVTIEGVTISNYWNSQERMNEAGLDIERGLALLVQADRFIMRDSALLGIQDTLELFTGRQYFENVFISGYTDFIFGTNNTTLFKNCTIHVIDTVKDDQGTAGYITAFKGSNKGAADAIVYGAIFDGCKFTADDGVTAGRTAIGRTWGAYAAVAVINSELGGHISVDGYDPANNKNKRYISMNGTHPTDATVQFVEFGNTGAGAVTAAVAGMKMLTEAEAALYTDISVIFGKVNGSVSWLDSWDPAVTEIVLDDRTYYNFDKSTSEGTSNTFDTETVIASGSTLEWAGILISAENGRVAWNANANALNMKAGAFIKFTVPAGTSVTVVTYPAYNFFTLNGVGTSSSNMLSQFYADETEVVLLSTGDLYLYQIIINPDEEAPATPTLDEIKVSGMNTNYVVGDELSLDGVVVKAYYSDSSVVEVVYQVDSSAVVNSAAGSYDVVFSYEGKTATVTVNYEDPNAAPEITKDTYLDFSTADALEAAKNNPKVTIDGSVRHNGGEIQIKGTISFPVKAGTVVTVIPYNNSTYVSYTIGMEGDTDLATYNVGCTFMAMKDGVVVYTGLDNNYLVAIDIKCPVAEGKYVFGASTEEGDVTGIVASVPGISISGTCKTHSGGAQLGQDSEIKFVLPAFATLTIKGFDTNYGLLEVSVGGTTLEMDANACYVYSTLDPREVVIKAVNAGTEEAPAYNKSYITYINVSVMQAIEENLNVTFGSAGNYKESGIDFSGIQIGDNGGDNSQIKNGSFSFAVKAGATVVINGYPKYTSYTFSDGSFTSAEITDEKYEYTAEGNVIITITPVNGNNYFYSIDIKYPAAKENVKVTFGSEGNYHDAPDAIDLSGVQIGDNGGNNSQVKNGSITITLFAGATLKIYGYSGYTDYTLSDGTTQTVVNKDSADHTEYVYTATADVTVTITPNSGNNYFYSIEIIY